jgi:hypothetical protein
MPICHFSFISEKEANGKVLLTTIYQRMFSGCRGLRTALLAMHQSNTGKPLMPQRRNVAGTPVVQGFKSPITR